MSIAEEWNEYRLEMITQEWIKARDLGHFERRALGLSLSQAHSFAE